MKYVQHYTVYELDQRQLAIFEVMLLSKSA